MNATPDTTRPPADLTVILFLARLLERIERSGTAPAPEQYRSVVERLSDALAAAPSGPLLQALLDAHPAAAELYENLNYQHAGLCRSPLEAALNAEMQAHAALNKAAGRDSAPSRG